MNKLQKKRLAVLTNEFKRYQNLLNLEDWIVDICLYEPFYCASIEVLSLEQRHAVLKVNVEALTSISHSKMVARHECFHLFTCGIGVIASRLINSIRNRSVQISMQNTLRMEMEKLSVVMQKYQLNKA